jgi:hypothetical protein
MFLLFQTGRVNNYSASSEFQEDWVRPARTHLPKPFGTSYGGPSRMDPPSTGPRTQQTIPESGKDGLGPRSVSCMGCCGLDGFLMNLL